MDTATAQENPLGAYLKDRRARLDPAALGYAAVRRRTPGLRREEVAQRAHISATWYTWLEQGRGGAPSGAVLERIAGALLLTEAEREHLFLLALGHAPEPRYRLDHGLPPRIQRVLDAMPDSPAFVRSLSWDVLAWNRAADAVFGYDGLEPARRNILRRIFCDPGKRPQPERDQVARFVVAAFRADVARARADAAGATGVEALLRELMQSGSEFAALWRDNDVRPYGEGVKRFAHPLAGVIALEYSSFTVDGRPDLALVVYNPATSNDADQVRALLARRR